MRGIGGMLAALLLASLVLAPFLMATPAAAHQQKIAISTVSHNPRTDMLEVVHRVPLHDAEHALKAIGDASPDILGDIESRRAFARYVAERFDVGTLDASLSLALLGSDIDGGYLLIFQEAHSPGRGAELMVRSQILLDVWARQESRVNLGSGTRVLTLIFRAGDGAKTGTLQ